MTLQKAKDFSALLLGMAGRALLALVAVLLVVMPWTEYFCNFDQFLRGGQDFELGLLCVLVVFCLVLVLFQHGRKVLAFLISMRRWLAGVLLLPVPSGSRFCGVTELRRFAALSWPGTKGSLPLRI